jgi:hypothetical protein
MVRNAPKTILLTLCLNRQVTVTVHVVCRGIGTDNCLLAHYLISISSVLQMEALSTKNLKFSLCLVKHHFIKTCGGVEK